MASSTFSGPVTSTNGFVGAINGTVGATTPAAGAFTTLSATGVTSLANGTVGAPALTFTSDADCGIYRIGANNLGIAVNGAKVIDVATTGASVTGALSATAAVHAYSGTAVPAGGTAGAGLKVSSVSNLGVFFGSGAPTLAAAQGSLYMRTDGSSTSTRLYVNTDGNTTWTNVTTAA